MYRLQGKDSKKPIIEFREQVMAKPLRGKRATRKMWAFATWVGIDVRTNEHVVVLGDGGAPIRVRTVLRRAASDRWNPEAIKAIKATPRTPNPKNCDRASTHVDMDLRGRKKIEINEDGANVAMDYGKDKRARVREFRIMKGILEKFGFSPHCKGCDATVFGTGARKEARGGDQE